LAKTATLPQFAIADGGICIKYSPPGAFDPALPRASFHRVFKAHCPSDSTSVTGMPPQPALRATSRPCHGDASPCAAIIESIRLSGRKTLNPVLHGILSRPESQDIAFVGIHVSAREYQRRRFAIVQPRQHG
jgi:hypothetical protein